MTEKLELLTPESVAKSGLMHAHDVEAVEAVYPGFVAAAIERVTARFAGRAASGVTDVMRSHATALVIAEVYRRRGQADPDQESRIREAEAAANVWLAPPPATKPEARAERPSTRIPPTGEPTK